MKQNRNFLYLGYIYVSAVINKEKTVHDEQYNY